MTKTVSGPWVVHGSLRLSELTIEPGGIILPCEGHTLTMTVDGVGTAIRPGHYSGDIVLTVAEDFRVTSVRFGQVTEPNFRMGICIDDGAYRPECSVPSVVSEGNVSNHRAQDLTIRSKEWDFNGIYVAGDSEFTVDRAKILLEGDGTDDFVGLGAGIAASGNARVTVNDSEIHTRGITRGAVFVGGHSEVTLNRCQLSLVSYIPTQEQLEEGKKLDRMMQPPWAMGIRGNGRTTNLAGFGVLRINGCHVTSNSWGVLSVDGATVNRMYVRDSLIELLGQSGYGCFSICDDLDFDYQAFGGYGCIDRLEHSILRVPTYGVIMSLGNASSEFCRGTIVESKRFGAFIFRNSGGYLRADTGTVFHTQEAVFLVKGSNVTISVDNAELHSENGIILQLMDNDDTGMEGDPFLVPVGETDTKDPTRDLTHADPTEDVFMSVSNMSVTGDFFNSTTDLKACCRVDKRMDDATREGKAPPMPLNIRGLGEDLQGAKNLNLRFENARVTGLVTCATAAYREGVTIITQENCEELGEITCTPAAAVNNGVILTLDGRTVWTVTGTCFLTALTVAEGAVIQGLDGQLPHMSVNGVAVPLAPGHYTGDIRIIPFTT